MGKGLPCADALAIGAQNGSELRRQRRLDVWQNQGQADRKQAKRGFPHL
jgi:hypothetical protein